jgi:hypothetical protein
VRRTWVVLCAAVAVAVLATAGVRVWFALAVVTLFVVLLEVRARRAARPSPAAPDPNALANGPDGSGEPQQVADLHRVTLASRERELGPDHPATLLSRDSLAFALHDLGRHQEAADLHRATLAACERAFGPDAPAALHSRNNLAGALHILGRHQEAADLHRVNVATCERVLGSDHPLTLASRSNLAHAAALLDQRHQAATPRWPWRQPKIQR